MFYTIISTDIHSTEPHSISLTPDAQNAFRLYTSETRRARWQERDARIILGRVNDDFETSDKWRPETVVEARIVLGVCGGR